MAIFNSAQRTVSQKLGIVCALAMAASVVTGDDQSLERVSGYHLSSSNKLSNESEAEALALIPVLIEFGEKVIGQLDHIYAEMLAGRIPLAKLHNEPFTNAGEIYSRALAQLKDMRGTGKLGPLGDSLIIMLAESRHKADRNANLIRQMIVEPKPYVSSIDRKGLVALARMGREAAATFES